MDGVGQTDWWGRWCDDVAGNNRAGRFTGPSTSWLRARCCHLLPLFATSSPSSLHSAMGALFAASSVPLALGGVVANDGLGWCRGSQWGVDWAGGRYHWLKLALELSERQDWPSSLCEGRGTQCCLLNPACTVTTTRIC